MARLLDAATAAADAAPVRSDESRVVEQSSFCKLVEYDELPDYLKDNEFIVGHYRCEWPLKQTLLSVFSVHNETLNVWTHLIGFFIFLCLTVATAVMMPREVNMNPSMEYHLPAPAMEMNGSAKMESRNSLSQSVSNGWRLPGFLISWLPLPPSFFSESGHDHNLTSTWLLTSVKEEMATPQPPIMTARWPFIAFLCGAMFCLLSSSACHLLMCHSERTAFLMLRLDYAGIAVLIVTSFFPLVYYSFMCHPVYCTLYIGFITAFGAATVCASLVPAFQTVEFRPARAALFACMAASGLVPILHKLVAFRERAEAVESAAYELAMGACYGVGVVVYVARIPERWMPGKFDLVGHSHQLFHVLVIAGAYAHYLAGLVYLKWRHVDTCFIY